ncbi:hypothetical protein TNCV_741171 [Trichonephila clavipes]|nr:hypothetical protein TNCV_741171 [Trichonephila clavipes]
MNKVTSQEVVNLCLAAIQAKTRRGIESLMSPIVSYGRSRYNLCSWAANLLVFRDDCSCFEEHPRRAPLARDLVGHRRLVAWSPPHAQVIGFWTESGFIAVNHMPPVCPSCVVHPVLWLATLPTVPLRLGSNPREDMVVCKCILPSRHGGPLHSLRDASPLVSGQVIYSQFGLAIHQNDHQARRRFVEWAQNEIAVVPDFQKRILFSDEAHFWLNGNVNKQNCRIWSEANPQLYVETPLHPEKLTVWCALWAGGILLQKR